jgi:hypothetical protein
VFTALYQTDHLFLFTNKVFSFGQTKPTFLLMFKSVFATLLVLSATLMACGQQSPKMTAEGKNVKVTYGQPSKRGREIFGRLVTYGKVWRTGANEATEITFAKDGNFGGKTVKKGTYTLFTIPGETEWTIILNSELKQWGAFKYDEIKGKNVLETKVPSKKNNSMVEKFTIEVSDTALNMMWDQTLVSVPLAF